MARSFQKSSSTSGIKIGSGSTGLGPLLNGKSKILLYCKAQPTTIDTGTSDNLIFHHTIAGSNNSTGLRIRIDNASGNARFAFTIRSVSTDTAVLSATQNTFNINSWGTFVVLIDFVAKTATSYTNNGTAVVTSLSGLANNSYTYGAGSGADWIGGYAANGTATTPTTGTTQFAGDLAEIGVAVYDAAESFPTTADIATLSAGTNLTSVIPKEKLVFYTPLYGANSTETDLIGGKVLTPLSGNVQSAHPFANTKFKASPVSYAYSTPNDLQITNGSAPVPIAPSITQVTATDTTVTFHLDEATTGHEGLSVQDSEGSKYALTYQSGDNTQDLVFTTYPRIMQGKTLTWNYVPGNIKDADNTVTQASNGNVTNNSTYTPAVIWDKNEGPWASVRIPSSVALSNGTVVMAAELRPVATDHTTKSIGVKRRFSNGTFSAEQNVAPYSGNPLPNGYKYNPKLVVLTSGAYAGRILLFYTAYVSGKNSATSGPNDYNLYLQYSDDNGVTFSAPADISTAIGVNRTTHYTFHFSPGSDRQLTVAPRAGHVALAVQIKLNANDSANYRMHILRSPDLHTKSDPSTATWVLGSPSDLGGDVEGSIGERADGAIVLINRNAASTSNGNARRQSVSNNGGASFGAGRWLTEIPMTTVQSDLISIPSQGLLILSGPNSTSARINGALWTSNNPQVGQTAGDEWANPYQINSGGASFAYSSIAYMPNGSFHILAEDDSTENMKEYVIPMSSLGITPPFSNGALSLTSVTQNSVTGSLTMPTNGTAPYTYRIERADIADASFTSPTTAVANTVQSNTISFTNNGLSPSTQYRYRGVQIDNVGAIVYSNVITPTTNANLVAGVLNAPTGATSTSIFNIVWSASTLGTAPYTYQLQKKLQSENESAYTNVVGQTTSPASLTGLSESSTPPIYSFRVKQTDSNNSFVYTNEVTGQQTATSSGGNMDDVFDTDWTDNAPTVVGSGANSQGSNSIGGGTGWVDFAGNQYRVNNNLLRNGLDTPPGDKPGITNALYIGDNTKKFKDGTTFVFSGETGTGDSAFGGGNLLRFNESNGGTGYAVFVGYSSVYVWQNYKGVQSLVGMQSIATNNKIANMVTGVTISDDTSIVTLLVNIYSPTNFNPNSPGTALETHTFTDTPGSSKPELLQSGRAGVATFNDKNIKRMTTKVASNVLTSGTLTVKKVLKTKALLNITAASGGSGNKTYTVVKDGSVTSQTTPAGDFWVTGNIAGSTHSFAIKTIDDSGNVTSNSVSTRFLNSTAEIISVRGNSRDTPEYSNSITILNREIATLVARNTYGAGEGINLSVSGATTDAYVASKTSDTASFVDYETTFVPLQASVNDFKKSINKTPQQVVTSLVDLMNTRYASGVKSLLEQEYYTLKPEDTEWPAASVVNDKLDQVYQLMLPYVDNVKLFANATNVATLSQQYPNEVPDQLHGNNVFVDRVGVNRANGPTLAQRVPDLNDYTGPNVLSAIINSIGTVITITLNEPGTGTSGLTLTVDGVVRPVNNWTRTSSTVLTGTISTVVYKLQTVSLTFNTSSGNIVDYSQNKLVLSPSPYTVTNNSDVTSNSGGDDVWTTQQRDLVLAMVNTWTNMTESVSSVDRFKASALTQVPTSSGVTVGNSNDINITKLTINSPTFQSSGREIMTIVVEGKGLDFPVALDGINIYIVVGDTGNRYSPTKTSENSVLGRFRTTDGVSYVECRIGNATGGTTLNQLALAGTPTGKAYQVWLFFDGGPDEEELWISAGNITVFGAPA